ncbi:hypothetical protein NA57DRAFT_73268 [Rhizodiscina lignyota]|uniref:Exocyst complex component SEC5 n=1 Tax=Rhizodiscina lignyota TaxID=1504668 RepID=A0A9P4IM71_9PEZI|nr:hypothetical protein NA57DRAFT_73268 [Rhizodiscina lignyota]
MANVEATLLNHYKIDSLYPAEWPAEKDQEDSSDEEEQPKTLNANPVRRSKTRYSVLERNPRQRASIPGSQKTKDGVENLVQKDEPDPLGGAGSVVQILRARGLPVEDDLKLRNRFLLSSTTFSPSLFLSQVHNNASTESLLQGLDFLSRSIEQKSASLKVLVESNFERFVRAKATIDNVYKEMRDQGAEANERPTSSGRPPSSRFSRPQSRRASINSHFRKTSGPFSPQFTPNFDSGTATHADKKKNALVKEQEYGVQPIKAPLLEVAVKAEEVWGPALGGRDKEENLRAVLSSIEKNRTLFELGMSIQEAIKRRDHDSIVEDYNKAHRYADAAKDIAERATSNGMALSDQEMHQIIVTARMWSDVSQQVDAFKRDVWRRLAGTHFTKQPATDDDKPEEHMELIGVLLELGVEDNPIWVWLLSRYDYLKGKVSATAERSRVEIEILRRRLANSEKPGPKVVAMYMRAASGNETFGSVSGLDSPKIIEFWEHVHNSLKALLAIQGGILGEVIEFWETAQSFIDGKAQRTLPSGHNGSARQHHHLSVDGVRELENGAMAILSLIRESVASFFVDPPIEDISALFSPIPETPDTPRTPKTPKSAALSPFSDSRFRFDPNNLPPPSPRRGESWEKYAFWPPNSNSLSGTHYLSAMLQLVGTAASEMGALRLDRDGTRANEELRTFIVNVRDRCTQAANAAWAFDAENCGNLEDWTRLAQRPELTKMPSRFMAFESSILTGMQKILFLTDAITRPDAQRVVPPPSAKLLQGVRSNFVASLYKTLTSMLENVNKPSTLEDNVEGEGESLIVPAHAATVGDTVSYGVDSTKKNVRSLLTLSNLYNLRAEVVPQLIAQFESNFSVQLADESKAIADVFSEIDSRLFQSYINPIATKIAGIINSGILAPSWAPASGQRPTDARPYVYSVLLELVSVHTEVSTTAPPLTPLILKHLLEGLTGSLKEAFQKRRNYNLAALMQATLDVEFVAQTLNNYTTDKTSEMQSQIYVVLDSRTDKDARMRLQDELQEMRGILKKLKEATRGEFACFKRQRAGAGSQRAPSRP